MLDILEENAHKRTSWMMNEHFCLISGTLRKSDSSECHHQPAKTGCNLFHHYTNRHDLCICIMVMYQYAIDQTSNSEISMLGVCVVFLSWASLAVIQPLKNLCCNKPMPLWHNLNQKWMLRALKGSIYGTVMNHTQFCSINSI